MRIVFMVTHSYSMAGIGTLPLCDVCTAAHGDGRCPCRRADSLPVPRCLSIGAHAVIASAKRLLLALVFAVPVAAIVLPPAPVMAQTTTETTGTATSKKTKKQKKTTKKTKKTKQKGATTTG